MKYRIAKTSDIRRIAAKKDIIMSRRFKTLHEAIGFMNVTKGAGIYLHQELVELPAGYMVKIYSYYL